MKGSCLFSPSTIRTALAFLALVCISTSFSRFPNHGEVAAFTLVPSTTRSPARTAGRKLKTSVVLSAAGGSGGGGESEQDRKQRLARLGYTEDEIARMDKENQAEPTQRQKQQNKDLSVNVQEFEVDAFTLTAVGFALIAFNFFVFANAGDGGIGGVVARIINLSKQ